MKQFRNSPITNWIDRNARNRIINQFIFEELYKDTPTWTQKVQERLKFYNIEISADTLHRYAKDLKDIREPVCASAFNNSTNGLSARVGKEVMYGQFDMLVKLFINEIKYIGLPANQILSIARKYKNIVACERDFEMYKFMSFLKQNFADQQIEIINSDLFKYFDSTDKKFNVFDIDLMLVMTEELVDKLYTSIINHCEVPSVVNIVSCVGRKISDIEYEIRTTRLIRLLKSRMLHHYSGRYCDHVIPMRFEMFVIGEQNDRV